MPVPLSCRGGARIPTAPGRSTATIAVLALLVVGCTGGSDAAVEPPETDADLAVVGTDTLRWEPERLRAEAGEITVALTCQGGVNHNLVIEEVGQIAECSRGETAEASVELDAGTYEYVCTIPGHARTMTGELTVE